MTLIRVSRWTLTSRVCYFRRPLRGSNTSSLVIASEDSARASTISSIRLTQRRDYTVYMRVDFALGKRRHVKFRRYVMVIVEKCREKGIQSIIVRHPVS